MSTRTKILETASTLFGELGFDAASTRQIADRSGVNKALIHYHFKTKEELFSAVFDDYYQRLVQALLASLEAEGPLEQRFTKMVDAYIDFLAENRDLGCVIQWEASGGKNLERIIDQMAPLFERGIELIEARFPRTKSGELAAPQLLVSFYGMIVTYFVHTPLVGRILGIDPLSDDSLAARKSHLRQMLSLVLRELEPDAPFQIRAAEER